MLDVKLVITGDYEEDLRQSGNLLQCYRRALMTFEIENRRSKTLSKEAGKALDELRSNVEMNANVMFKELERLNIERANKEQEMAINWTAVDDSQEVQKDLQKEWKEYNKKAAIFNSATSHSFAPIKDVTDGTWIKDLDSHNKLKTYVVHYNKWAKALGISELINDCPPERQYQLLLWCIQGKIDENGWIGEGSSGPEMEVEVYSSSSV